MRPRPQLVAKARTRGCARGPVLGPAFTLLELLVVMAIIVALVAVSLPALRGLNQSNTLSSATRQLLDDLAWARQKAITDRTVVHVVFVPPSIAGMTYLSNTTRDQKRNRRAIRQLKGEAFSAYGFFAERTAGDQPGQASPRYLRQWHFLPDGIFFAPWEFNVLTPAAWDAVPANQLETRPFKYNNFPFPTVAGDIHSVPHVSFDPLGRLLVLNQAGQRVFGDEIVSLARGSVLVQRDANYDVTDFNFLEIPPGNSTDNYIRVRIDGLTGRARVEQPQIQ